MLTVSALIISARGEWQNPGNLAPRGIAFLILSGVATGLSWLCYYRVLQSGRVSSVAPIHKLSVVLVAIVAVVVLGERLAWKVGIGAILVAAGAALMAL